MNACSDSREEARTCIAALAFSMNRDMSMLGLTSRKSPSSASSRPNSTASMMILGMAPSSGEGNGEAAGVHGVGDADARCRSGVSRLRLRCAVSSRRRCCQRTGVHVHHPIASWEGRRDEVYLSCQGRAPPGTAPGLTRRWPCRGPAAAGRHRRARRRPDGQWAHDAQMTTPHHHQGVLRVPGLGQADASARCA